jgi:hypothetical protein
VHFLSDDANGLNVVIVLSKGGSGYSSVPIQLTTSITTLKKKKEFNFVVVAKNQSKYEKK